MDKSNRSAILQQIAEVEEQIAHLQEQWDLAEATLQSLRKRLSQGSNAITEHPDLSGEIPVTRGSELSGVSVTTSRQYHLNEVCHFILLYSERIFTLVYTYY